MEHIEGTTLDWQIPHPPRGIRGEVEKAVKTMHNRQFVFGDLRAPNVMITGAKVCLIDFDRSGNVNEARCPLNLSTKVTRPERES